ncbi:MULTISPECIES: hypothetical protein [Spirulina sp. CCY15215]|uniref:hypothetical protein n=1 Tax=Spirulina sp. CCY15215 TaxID=2767591 RepID=UPI00194ECBD8|nr:hypothetical protein [Spirulina major]
MSVKELIYAELDLMSDQKLEEIYQIIQKLHKEETEEISDWDKLSKFFDENAIETGIPDLAEQHDHYIHGCPKREKEG